MTTLSFDQGTIVLSGLDEAFQIKPLGFIWDERVAGWRAEAFRYRETVIWLRKENIPYTDQARQYDPPGLSLKSISSLSLFDYQEQSIASWRHQGQRGIVVLPTGAGKTVVALEAISLANRPALIVVPTLDLLNQWYKRLTETFKIEIGLIGQGVCDIKDVTVITYQSAYRQIGGIGARFGFLIFDEVHHLTAPEWAEIARMAIAPFRLGLTATYDPRGSKELNETIGPLAYWKPIRELSGKRLAPYEVIRLSISLLPKERLAYERESAIYLDYWRRRSNQQAEDNRSSNRLQTLLQEQGRDVQARRALQAFQQMRRIVAGAEAKLDLLEQLFRRHASNRAIVFTANNEVAYKISRQFLIPAITHLTNARERKTILEWFESGEYEAVVTSKVLNEGVDVPEAVIAIILGGSGSTREHTQRLGRILRQRANKQAILYEITARGTIEAGTSHQRRQTEAYAGRGKRISRL